MNYSISNRISQALPPPSIGNFILVGHLGWVHPNSGSTQVYSLRPYKTVPQSLQTSKDPVRDSSCRQPAVWRTTSHG